MKEPPLHLIVGLGNPGAEYRATRHNVGFRVVERLADGRRGSFRPALRLLSETARIEVDSIPCLLVRPQTFMNRSGEAVVRLLQHFRVPLRRFLIVHDDLDLALGRIRILGDRGDGGHRGIRSVIDTLGTRDFARVRMGIGRPPSGTAAEAYVLEPFETGEMPVVEKAVETAARAAETFLRLGLTRTMNAFNRTPAEP